jgi:hypothetical protein
MKKKRKTRDVVKLYNKYAIKDLNQLMPDFTDFDVETYIPSKTIKCQLK